MALGDIYEVRLDFLHGNGEDASARWYYRCASAGSGAGNAAQLDTAFGAFVLAHVRNLLATDWTITNQLIKNLYNPADFVDEAIGLTGALGSNCLPPVLGVGIRSSRNDIGVNRAAKRMPLGVIEWVGANGIMTVEGRDACFFLCQTMGITAAAGDGDGWIPVIVQIEYSGGVISEITERAELLGQWTVNRWFTTQKSRQGYQWEVPEEPA